MRNAYRGSQLVRVMLTNACRSVPRVLSCTVVHCFVGSRFLFCTALYYFVQAVLSPCGIDVE